MSRENRLTELNLNHIFTLYLRFCDPDLLILLLSKVWDLDGKHTGLKMNLLSLISYAFYIHFTLITSDSVTLTYPFFYCPKFEILEDGWHAFRSENEFARLNSDDWRLTVVNKNFQVWIWELLADWSEMWWY